VKSDCQLVILRHGESEWNKKNLFTGWRDVPLSPEGEQEARDAGRILLDQGFAFDVAFTSVLSRAIKTLWLALEQMDLMWIPVHKHWRLNERHYGALQGSDKIEAVRKFGEAHVKEWRRGYTTRPPLVSTESMDYPKADPRYAGLPEADLPRGESLEDVLDRVLPYWHDCVVPELSEGKRVLIAAHGNSLRALMKYLENISDSEIVEINLPTGIPRAYSLDGHFKAVGARFLGDVAQIQTRIESVQKQTRAQT
jgi:2,3-bisphosphoglycerate-dependent phosphoglycerate mutase